MNGLFILFLAAVLFVGYQVKQENDEKEEETKATEPKIELIKPNSGDETAA